jgi:hypothetical protein
MRTYMAAVPMTFLTGLPQSAFAPPPLLAKRSYGCGSTVRTMARALERAEKVRKAVDLGIDILNIMFFDSCLENQGVEYSSVQ